MIHPKTNLIAISVVLLYSMMANVVTGQTQTAVMPDAHQKLFKQHCFDCHDADTQEGSVDLENLSFTISQDIATAERWAKVLNAINSGEMPPEDAEPISNDDKSAFLKDLSEQMVAARGILADNGGVVTLRRLNRREYSNTIDALLGVQPDVSSLPDDQASIEFDTQGASLFMSSDQIENYLAAAKSTLKLALLPREQRTSRTLRVEPEEEYTPHYTKSAEKMRDVRRRAEAYFAQKDQADAKPTSEFGFLDEYEANNKRKQEWLPLMENYLNRPETKTGATLILTIKEGGHTRVKFPTLGETDHGHYTIRVRVGAYPDARERLHYLELSEGIGANRNRLGWRKVAAPLSDPQIVEFPYTHRPGQISKVWIHQRSHQDRAGKDQATLDMRENGLGTPPGLWVDWAELIGPEPDKRSVKLAANILFEKPADWDDARYANEVLRRFATRAFRGEQPTKEYLEKLVQRYQVNRTRGQNLIEALIDPMSIVLASPSFLYMVESSGNDASPLLTGSELAARLSYMLWSAPPDETLLQLGQTGELLQDKTLSAQTSRMLADPRADVFVRGFVYQWLQMERLGMFQFDGVQYPTFDNAVRECAGEEIYQTFRYILDTKLPLQKLLKTDFVVINELLANYYGIPGVEGHEFRKVSVPADSIRGGLLGTAAVLAMGSDGQRSSPVERGAWVLRKLLNDPPPPAPPNVPMLSRLDGEVLAARELAIAHQEQPQCANCHQKIDPLGYGLENFDAVGRWRDVETIDKKGDFGKRIKLKEFPIDPSGQLTDGTEFADFFELRDVVAGRGDDFASGFTESLITYGLGRPYGFTDKELADEILAHARDNHHEVSSFIHALTQSSAFRTK